jgi:NAD(P)-dependent dehydrogenase (short-subunit alcohol dehydrogenase family)
MNSDLESLFSLRGRRAIVTGGAGGVGEMLARGLLIGGASVHIVGRYLEKVEAKARELRQLGECQALQADLATDAGIEAVRDAAAAWPGGLGILINNAGMLARAPLGEFTSAQWDSVLGLNLKAPFLLTQALLPSLRRPATASCPSHVINIGSAAGLGSTTVDTYSYGPSKAALHHMTRVLARKLAPEHIHVNAIAPGLFPSRMSASVLDDPQKRAVMLARIPAGRLGEPDDMAALVVSLAASRYQTGTITALDGGQTC